MATIRKYRIKSTRELSPTTRAFILEPIGEAIDFEAGQFAFLHILDEKGETVVKRPYSIASAPGEDLEFCIKLVQGEMTGRLEQMKPGEIVGVQEGGGHFSFNDQDKGVFIAGGTGIAPMMSMLRHIVRNDIKGEFTLFYSARTRNDILYREELKELEKREGIRIVITLTREEWEGETGRICHTLMKRYLDAPSECSWWVCGPMGLITAMKHCLLSLEAKPEKIRLEGWG